MAEELDVSQKVLFDKSKVKFYFSTVRSRVIPILKRVEAGDYPSKIARLYVEQTTYFLVPKKARKSWFNTSKSTFKCSIL